MLFVSYLNQQIEIYLMIFKGGHIVHENWTFIFISIPFGGLEIEIDNHLSNQIIFFLRK